MNSLLLYNNSKEFDLIELNEQPYFFYCKYCHNDPEIIIKDNEYILIECSYCNIKKEEKISNISNYSCEWMRNEVIRFCELNHKEKKLSVTYCKTCNLFLCEECFQLHNQNKDIIHDYLKISNIKINFCKFHNYKYSYYCEKCDIEFCGKCFENHRYHSFIKFDDNMINNKIYNSILNINKFENFL